ncbi:MAG: RimK family alpha-L-glutamate ligase [Ilumatobacteraceae bacterium]
MSTTVHNPQEIVRWNMDKRYLRELTSAGIPVIPTTFVESVADLDRARFGPDVMVKPTMSAGSNDTARFVDDPEAARSFAKMILDTDRAVMMQPYESAIDEMGETGLLYFSGKFSHAFCKGAIFRDGDATHNGLYVEEEISPRQPSTHEIDLGDRALQMVNDRFGTIPVYARVDMVSSPDGSASIMEVELIEPSLFLHVDERAAANAAQALTALVEP